MLVSGYPLENPADGGKGGGGRGVGERGQERAEALACSCLRRGVDNYNGVLWQGPG